MHRLVVDTTRRGPMQGSSSPLEIEPMGGWATEGKRLGLFRGWSRPALASVNHCKGCSISRPPWQGLGKGPPAYRRPVAPAASARQARRATCVLPYPAGLAFARRRHFFMSALERVIFGPVTAFALSASSCLSLISSS